MKATKCSKCGFVGFADQGCCKRCGSAVDFNEQAPVIAVHVEKSRYGLWFKLKVVLGIAMIVVGAVVGYFKLTKYFDETPSYVAAISNSEKFKEPVTVRVNRKEIARRRDLSEYITPKEKEAGGAVAAADILEALGLISLSVETSVRTVKGPSQYDGGMFMDGRMISAPRVIENFRDVKSNTLMIELTEKGRLEAANWKEADEPLSPGAIPDPLQGRQVLPWWIIPIGDREILRIEKVEPGRSGPNLEVMIITFRWRWRPNKLGENFDLTSGAFTALPLKAREAVTSLNMSSRYEHVGIARLNKRDGDWECVDITFPVEPIKN